MKKIIYSLVALTAVVSMTSCKKYLNINSDPDTPQNPLNSSVFPAMLGNIPYAFQRDARYVGKYDQNWLANANGNADTWDRHGYVAGSDAAGDIWRQTYYGLGKNLDYIIENGIQQKQFDYVGASYALKALFFQTATDYHGEIIFGEAFKEGTYYFKYDTQDKVYKGVDSLCRIALNYLDQAATSTIPQTLKSSDYVYNGDISKWKKFVYGILARNYGHLTNKASFQADSVIKFTDLALSTVADDFVVPFDATKNDDANFFGPYRDNLGSFRQSNFIVKLLDGTALAGGTAGYQRDPRISHMLSASFDTTNGNGGYRGVEPGVGDPYSALTAPSTYTVGSANWINSRKKVSTPWGDSTQANPSSAVFTASAGKYLFKDKAVCPVMTASEMQFLKAEAAFRKGDKTTAYAAYLNGINLHFDFINRSYSGLRGNANIFNTNPITAAQRAAYLAGPNVKQTAAALTLTDIMLQKYIALWGWGWVETWVDLRRYHYTDLDPATGLQVYKGFSLPTSFFPDNKNKPAYRVRPRYNSEYVWNADQLALFGGLNADYHTYEMWFSMQ